MTGDDVLRLLIFATALLAASALQAADFPPLAPFLTQTDLQRIQSAVPAPPARGDVADTLDHLIYQETRGLLHGARGQAAAEDDIFDVDQITPTFSAAYGLRLSRQQQPELFRLLDDLMGAPGEAYGVLHAFKKNPAFFRTRPIAEFGDKADTCVKPVDMAGYAHEDLVTYDVPKSSSYPSGHSFRGMMTALVLAEVRPDHAADLINRGEEFGESRVICGFHWESDIVAGRLVALKVADALRANPDFMAEIEKIRHDKAAASDAK
jgi:acid phosphatase (class A)